MIFISRLVKCPFCEQYFNKDKTDFVFKKNRYWHKECFEEKYPNEEEKEELREYIKKLLNIEQLTPLINKQLKVYIEENKFTYSGILGTLMYCYEVKKIDRTKAKGIGIVLYTYNEAKEYFEQKKVEQKRINEESKEIQYRKKEKIKIKVDINNHVKKRRKII